MKIDFNECERRCKKLARKIKKLKGVKDIYGIPRGGMYIALRLSHLTGLPITFNPKEKTTIILDEIKDSGNTERNFKNFKHFYVIVDKQKEKIEEWVDFFWEEK